MPGNLFDREPFPYNGPLSLVTWDSGEKSLVPEDAAKRLEKEQEERARQALASLSPDSPWRGAIDGLLEKRREEQPMLAGPPTAPAQAPAKAPPTNVPNPPVFGQETVQAARQAAAQEAATAVDPFTRLPAQMVVDAATRGVWVPGSPGRPGYGPEDEAKRFKSRESEAQSVTGPDLTPEERDQMLQSIVASERYRMEADAKMREVEAEKARQDVNLRQVEFGMQQKRLELMQQEQDAAQFEYDSMKQNIEAEVREAAKEEVNQSRFFESKSSLQRILMVASIALANYASKGTDGGIVMRAIERDIESQQLRITNRRKNADNALSRLSERFGSLQAGKAALRAVQEQTALQYMKTIASSYNNQNMTKALQAAELESAARANDAWNQARMSFVGKRTEEAAQRYRDPVAAVAPTPGYTRSLTWEELHGENGRLAALQGLAQRGAQIEKLSREASGEVDANKRAALQAQLGEQMEKLSNLKTALDQVLTVTGITFKNGVAVAPDSGIPGFQSGVLGKLSAPLPPMTPKSREVRRTVKRLLIGTLRKESGANYNEQEAIDMAERIMGAETEESLLARITMTKQEIDNSVNAIRAGYPSVIDAYDKELARQKGITALGNSAGILARNPLEDD